MDFGLIEKACVLVTLTFILTRTRLIAHLLKPRLPIREQLVTLLVFLIMAALEELVAGHYHSMNIRIVAICAAGLLAGPWVGCAVGVWATVLACWYHPEFAPVTIGLSMVLAGLAAGMLRRWRPALAINPATGFVLGVLTQLLRYALALAFAPLLHTLGSAKSLPDELIAAALQGTGVTLVLLVVAQVRWQEEQAHATAMAEVRALQARMNPHFLFNALNTLSALSLIDPRSVPGATARLGKFLRASLDQHDRPLVTLQEELSTVRAYLDIEALRLEDRLSVDHEIEPGVFNAAVPPFLLQPIVENAIQYGIQPCPHGGHILLKASSLGHWLWLVVANTGIGISADQRSRVFCPDDYHVHALLLLRRRLHGLYGTEFVFTVDGCPDVGTTVTIQIPLHYIRPMPIPQTEKAIAAEDPASSFDKRPSLRD